MWNTEGDLNSSAIQVPFWYPCRVPVIQFYGGCGSRVSLTV